MVEGIVEVNRCKSLVFIGVSLGGTVDYKHTNTEKCPIIDIMLNRVIIY